MRRALVLLVAAASVAAVTGAVPGAVPAASAVEAAPARLATPLLSLRRVPEALVGFRAEARLQASVERLVADPALAPWTSGACVVVRVGDRTLVSRKADQPVIPASALKLLTAEAAATVLGP